MNKSLFYIVVVAAIGGFLFGFDSGVISGCEKAIQSEFGLSTQVEMMPFGTTIIVQ
jgi:uncharacterized membrane protein YedE/YeeE